MNLNSLNNKIIMSLVLLCVLFNSVMEITATVFADITNMEELLEHQARIIDFYDKKIETIEHFRKRRALLRFVGICKMEQSIAMNNVSLYLYNPLNAFCLVKRLTTDLKFVEAVTNIRYIDYKVLEKSFTSNTVSLASNAINSLITHYYLNVKDLSDGVLVINKRLLSTYEETDDIFVDYSSPLLSTDCYVLAVAAYDEGLYGIAEEWMGEAQRKYEQECYSDCPISRIMCAAFLEHIKFAKHSKMVAVNDEMVIDKKILNDPPPINQLCVGAHFPKGLTCQYRNGPHPFLQLARFKTEQIHLNPDITMFHDVISDEETAILKDMASHGVVILQKDESESTLKMLSLRVLDMSGRSTGVSLAEPWQVSFYGPGGYDFNQNVDAPRYWAQFRQATTIFYLSDVLLGGATTFNSLSLSVQPKKNAALYWQNFASPATGLDGGIRHTSCPLLFGSKLVAIKWLSDIKVSCPRPAIKTSSCFTMHNDSRPHGRIWGNRPRLNYEIKNNVPTKYMRRF